MTGLFQAPIVPGPVYTAKTAGEVVALADYPALAHLLGAAHFARLAHAAAERGARENALPEDLVHSLLVRDSTLLPDRVPSRMAADVAAVEREILQIGRLLPLCDGLPRLRADSLRDLDHDALRAARLEPIRALGVVPVGYRVDGYVRRVRVGKLPGHPKRAAQTVVVYALVPDAPVAWWRAVNPAEGRMLSKVALGETLGAAIDPSITPDGFPDQAAALDALMLWIREGLFTRILPG